MQQRRLFHNPSSKSKLSYVVIGCAIIGSFIYWSSFVGHTPANTGNVPPMEELRGKPYIEEKAPAVKKNAAGDHNNGYIRIDSHHVIGNAVDDNLPQNGASDASDSSDASPSTDDGDAMKISQTEAHDSDLDPALEENKKDSTGNESALFDKFKCSFREYKPHRYYPVDDLSEKFLSDAEYIRGELPFVINPRNKDDTSSMPKKLCTDTSEWENVLADHRPFSDGQNPSFVSLASDAYNTGNGARPRIDRSTIEPLVQIYGAESIDNLFLGLLLFGDSQCRWNMTAGELERNKFSPLQEAPSKRSMVMILNENLDPIGRAVLELEHDATWGETRKKYGVKAKADGQGFERSIVELDDARLFFHNGRLHVLYRNGPSFGYTSKYGHDYVWL